MKITMNALVFLFIIFLTSCRQGPKEFESIVKIIRMDKVTEDIHSNNAVVDLAISYIKCEGTQIEVIRGDNEFEKCMFTNHKVGDEIKVKIIWDWDTHGYYKWEVVQLNHCPRKIDPEDITSYNMIEECEDFMLYGAKIGFKCKRVPTDKLIKQCPWFRKE